MATTSSKYFSIRFTQMYMKVTGFWDAQTKKERLRLRINFTYMLLVLLGSLWNESLDLYYSRGDLYELTFVGCLTIPLIVTLMKVITFTIRHKEITWLIKCAKEYFWYKEYSVAEESILNDVDKRVTFYMCSFTTCIFVLPVLFVIFPLIENVEKKGADRVLPFRLRFFSTPTTSPYYEIIFVTEIFLVLNAAVYFCCFDNFLCMLCMNVSGQFRILQKKLQTIFDHDYLRRKRATVYSEFKNCIIYHQLLIFYVKRLEYTFRFPLLGQLVISSIVLCISGFQICVIDSSMKRLLFLVYFFGGIIQIYLITYNSNNIIVESNAVGEAIYSCNWETSSYKEFDKFRKDILTVILRSKQPCHLTAGKFFPISLESFMKVLSATASYFTLLRTMEENNDLQQQ